MYESKPNLRTYTDYGQQFADFYDDIFPRHQLSDIEVAWLADRIPPAAQSVVELGVGTGRVALPLQEMLARTGRKVRFTGIDISQEMLEMLRLVDPAGTVERRQGDISSFEYNIEPDVILCVCATISMICDPVMQRTTIEKAAEALKPGGTLIVETHNATAISAMHVADTVTFCVPYPGNQRALVSFSTLEGKSWHVDHAWIDAGTARFASEDSRLTTLEELDDYATGSGLIKASHTRGFSDNPVTDNCPTVTAVYSKPETLRPQS
ncbi:class I SAM-dependent methyltransferase [Arthrobacter sp. efr-133-R2A-120]|uniref:class I SAM-dependent methyltransferase n=1 Tax=Arthrobacter sp. efr-133-R2A-120 TaxID=3040277 RepID=UPI00254C43EA|nr:class I SAM-dependent methyltransferase [Arthrobacter sp. efr-133-R2A-120]